MTRATSLTLSLAFALLLIASQALSADAAPKSAPATFGDKPVFKSADNVDYQLSDDKEAFTLAFTAFETTAGVGAATARAGSAKSDGPVGTRAFSIVLPLSGNHSVRTTFLANGFVVTGPEAGATLVLVVNGKSKVVKFPPNQNHDFVEALPFRATGVPEIRITAFLLTERNSGNPESSAFLGVNSIETDTALAKKAKPKTN